MDAITELTTINYLPVFLGIFIIIFGVKEIIEIITYFKKKFRIKTGIDTDKETTESRLSKLESHSEWQYNEILKISKGVEEIEKQLLLKDINDKRLEIIGVADRISNGSFVSHDTHAHALKTYDEYEEIIKRNHMTNSEVDASIEIIKQSYIQNGFKDNK